MAVREFHIVVGADRRPRVSEVEARLVQFLQLSAVEDTAQIPYTMNRRHVNVLLDN